MPIMVNDLQSSQPLTEEQQGLLERVLQAGLERYQKPGAEVSIVVADNPYIQELNREYRGIDQPTDVLSFAMREEMPDTEIPGGPAFLPEGAPELLGDIYISIERTIEQAADYGHSFERELCYLGCHGLLHLLGFDHQTPDDTVKMRAAEEALLSGFSLGREGKLTKLEDCD